MLYFHCTARILMLYLQKIIGFLQGIYIMKTKEFIRNSSYLIIGQLFVYILDFICRIVFIHYIPQEYVGVKGLFTNILNILSLSELGIGSVLVIYMYRPLATHDTLRVASLVRLYRKLYRIIIPTIFIAGCCLIPFLPHMISGTSTIHGLTIIYLLYLLRSVFGFYNGHLCALFMADQKAHYVSLAGYMSQICASVLQIIFLILTRDIFIYLVIQLLTMIMQKCFLGWLARKKYPSVCKCDAPALDKSEQKEIFRNVHAMFQHRLGATVLSSTDNIIISKFIGITIVAINDAYNSILSVITQLLSQIFVLLTSIIGASNATSSREESCKKFFDLHFINFWFYTFCSCSLLLLLHPVIRIFFGTSYIFDSSIEFLLVLNFYIVGIRQITILFKESLGLIQQDRWVPIIEVCINIAISLLGVYYFGTIGVFIGTTISMMITSFPIEPYILFHYGFEKPVRTFWRTSFPYYLLSALLLASCYEIDKTCSLSNDWLTLGIRLLIALLYPNLVILLLYHRSPQCQQMQNILRQALKRNK